MRVQRVLVKKHKKSEPKFAIFVVGPQDFLLLIFNTPRFYGIAT